MGRVIWSNCKIVFGICIKGVLVVPMLTICLNAWVVTKLDKVICYLWRSVDEMIDNAYVENIYGK